MWRKLRPPLLPILYLFCWADSCSHLLRTWIYIYIPGGRLHRTKWMGVRWDTPSSPKVWTFNEFCSGWGVTSENGANLADKLLELEVNILFTLQNWSLKTPFFQICSIMINPIWFWMVDHLLLMGKIAKVPIVSDSVCASAMSSVSIGITSDMLCAGFLT